MDANHDGIEDTTYTCFNCHKSVPNATGGFEMEQTFRDCLFCHIVEDREVTVHHNTPLAKKAQCGTCHGSLVRNLDEGVPIPTYNPGLTTPWRSGKPNADTNITSSAGTHPGNCNFCHNTQDGITHDNNGQPVGTPNVPSEFGPITVFSTSENHHGTGISRIVPDPAMGGVCTWCHDIHNLMEKAIRTCQRCHDTESLHNIQYDADGDGIVPLAETAYQGHIGNSDDCWGCHGNNGDVTVTPLAPISKPQITIPQLENLNLLTWKTGTAFEMTLSGNGFINQGGLVSGITFRPTVQLTDNNGNATILMPNAESVNSVQVSIPNTLPASNYWVQIKKDSVLSNPIAISITPAIQPGPAICVAKLGIMLIRGNNFSMFLQGSDSGTRITGDGIDANIIYFWRDHMIAARFNGGCPTTVEVTNVFDSITLTPLIW